MTGIKTKDLTDRAMLVSLNIKNWNIIRKDKNATATITEKYNSDAGWAKGSKYLADPKDMSEINNAISAARQFHQTYTSPWSDEGNYRILASVNYMFYTDRMREYNNQFTAAVSDFINVKYPDVKEKAFLALKGLFNELEYPDVDRLKDKFAFNVSVSPIPSADDFRITQISDSDIEDIKSQITRKMEESQRLIIKDLWERLYDVVEKAAITFKDPTAKFHDSKIDNIEEMIEVLKKLNFDNDPKLDRMCDAVTQRLVNIDVEEIRKDKEVRAEVAESAQNILDRIASYM